MQDTSRLDLDSRRELFVESFSWRRDTLRWAVEHDPADSAAAARLREMDELLDEFGYDFEADSFYYAEVGYAAVATL